MNMKHVIAASLVVFGFSLQASAQSSASLLARDLLVSAKTLKTDKKIYNYFTLPEMHSSFATAQGRNSYINMYLSQRGGDFWREDFRDSSPKLFAAGPGLYFAIDPLISESFGNTFIAVTMPAGTRFINVVSPIALKKDTMTALISEGFITQSQASVLFPKRSGFYRDTLRMMVQPEFAQFRRLVQTVFAQNNIQFVEYNFNSSLGHFCNKHSYSAFVYVGQENSADPKNSIVPEAIRGTTMYSTKLNFPSPSAGESAEFNAIIKFKNVLEAIKGKGTASAKQYISTQYSPAEYQAVRNATVSCE